MPDAASHCSNLRIWDPQRVEGGSVTTFHFSSPACSQTTPMQFPHAKHALSSFLCNNCAVHGTLCSPHLFLTVSSFIPRALLV